MVVAAAAGFAGEVFGEEFVGVVVVGAAVVEAEALLPLLLSLLLLVFIWRRWIGGSNTRGSPSR